MDLTDEMRDWIDDAIGRTGRQARGPVELVRARPWALVCRIDTDLGVVWAKFPHSAFAYEGRLATVLDHLVPGAVHAPLVVDQDGWMLSADGGAAFTDHVDGTEALDTYRRIAEGSATDVAQLLEAGAPDRRPAALPATWAALIEAVEDTDLRRRARAAEDRFAAAIDVLAADGRAAICNTDLRPSHAFVGPPVRIFDWGDATVAHPLCCLGAVRSFTRDQDEQRSLIEQTWRGEPAALIRAAGAVESLLRADVWRRDPPGARERHPGMVDFWVTDALDQLEP